MKQGCSTYRPFIIVILLTGILEPLYGDTIFFKGGMEYDRNLDLSFAGSEDSPLVITSSGIGKAIINAGTGLGLQLKNCRNVTIENLAFKGNGRLTGNLENGVIIDDCKDITIRDLDIQGFQHSGLLVEGASNGIYIEEVYAYDNGFAGIHVIGEWPDKYQCKNIYIGHCTAENNPGDPTVLDNHSGNGIIVGSCDSVLIEYCEALENGWDMPRTGNGPVGIWAWNADHVTIQHCIAHHNKTSPGGHDGGGFDLDGGVTNSVIQYCLTYENEGAGFGVFEYASAPLFNNNTIRYNISINDGSKNGNTAVMVWNGRKDPAMLSDVKIYNNVFYNDRSEGSAVVFLDIYYEEILFANNIFMTDGPAIKGPYAQSQFIGNIYYNFGNSFRIEAYSSFQEWVSATGQETLDGTVVGMNTNPMFSDPGSVTITDPDSLNLEILSGFCLKSISPVIDKGLDLMSYFGIDPGNRDMFGQPIPAGTGFEPGVYEFQGYTQVPVRNEMAPGWIKVFSSPLEKGKFYMVLTDQEGAEEIQYFIRDLGGRKIGSGYLVVSGELQTINLPASVQSGGVYFITVKTGERSITKKLIL